MKRMGLGTMILMIVILALMMALVIQSWRQRVQVRDLLLELRDARATAVGLKENELLRMMSRGASRDDPAVKTAWNELKALHAELKTSMERLRATQRSINRLNRALP
jgi:hypothetical protein